MRTVANILIAEFLSDVHVTCAKCSDSDWRPLQKYLLRGRGCVILQVLHTIGLQVSVWITASFTLHSSDSICSGRPPVASYVSCSSPFFHCFSSSSDHRSMTSRDATSTTDSVRVLC